MSDNKKKHQIGICMGIACLSKGAQNILQELTALLKETEATDMFNVGPIRCPGECHNAPVVVFNRKILVKQSPESIRALIYSIIRP